MNKQLKLLQRSKVLKTLEVEKVKHDLSKIKNSTIVMVAYDDATDKFLIGDNSGDLYVATSEYLKSLDIKNSSIDSIINGMTKSSIAQHFNKISLQEAKEMFGKKYLYYWSANNKIYGVKRGIIERLDNGPDNTSVVELWSRNENVLSNDRGVSGLKEVKFSSELRPAFLTFNKDAIPTYTRDNYLTVRDPVKVADIMNNELQNHDYVPKDDKYGYDMKDSNAVMKAYLGTDDLVILSNIDKRKVIDIDPPTVDPDNPDVEYNNNTPFNHNYNMVWSTIRSARLFEEFNDEVNDNNSNFVNMTRHERSELTNFTLNNHVDAAGLYANIPNLSYAYTIYINGKDFGDKQIYSNGIVAVSIKNDFKWSLDRIDGDKCTITKRVYNSVTGEVTNAQRTYDGVVEFEIVNIKDNTTRIRKTFKIPSLNNSVCDFDKFEYKHDSTGTAISLPVPEEYEDGIIEYKLDTTKFAQGTNGKISYGLREIYIQSGATKYFIGSTNGTGTAAFSVYTLAANSTSATIKRNTEIIFKNTDGTNYSYRTTNNGIGTGSVEHLVANTPTGVSNNNHISRHTRNVHYMSGSTDVICKTDYSDPNVNYKIYTLNVGSTTATLKGSSTGTFKTISNGSETSTTYNVVKNDHITVTSNTITYTRNTETYTSASNITCSQTMNVDYTYGGITIRKTITKSAAVNHSIYNLSANATTATIKRVFTPVFYTISAGIESSSIIYKNDTIIIDTNKTATVTHTVSDSVTSASGSTHYATHTRTVTYTQNNVTVNVNTEKYNDAVITFKIWTLNAGSTTATLKGSSTGVFKTVINGSESTTYNVVKNDHITVTSNTITYTRNTETYTSASNITCSQTMNVDYTYGGITIRKTITKSAAVNHSILTLSANATTATIKRVFTPVFKTIVNGSETTSNYKADQITIDTNKTATVTHTVSDSPTSASGSNHYAKHTRTVTYTQNNVTVNVNTTNVNGAITYKIWTLEANATTATLKGSSTGEFTTYNHGYVTSTTYNVVKNDHITVTSNPITYTRNTETYTSASDIKCSQTMNVDYTYGGITIRKTITKSANIVHSIYTLSANATTATIKRVFTPVFKTIANGSETTSNYKADQITIDTNKTATVTHTVSDSPTSASGSNHYAKHTRTVTYTQNNVTVNVNTTNVNGAITYKIWTLYPYPATANLKGSSTGEFKTIVNGSETDTTYKVTETDHITVDYDNVNVSETVSDSPTSASGSNHYATHTRTVTYTYEDVTVTVDITKVNAPITYKIWTLEAGSTTATLKGSSTGEFKRIKNGSESTTYTISETNHITVTSNPITYTRNTEKYISASNVSCSQTMNVDYTYGGVTIRTTITKSDAVIHSIYNLSANATTATIKRVFTPVFKTIIDGSQTTSIYKADQVTIDTNKIATVTHTVSDSVTSASGSNHYAKHTRTVTYTQSNVTVNVNTTNVNGAITYKIWTLEANATTATLKGSSTGEFKTISNGSESTTYNVVKNDHITVTGNVNYTASSSVTSVSSNRHYATHTRTVTYTNSDVTLTINTTNYYASITYKIWSLLYDAIGNGSDTAELKGSSTGRFKTIVDGSETSTSYGVYKNDHITVTGNVSHTVSDSVTSASESNHYATHTRTVTYTYEDVTVHVNTTRYTTAAITYKIWTLNANATTATLKGSSTGVFKTIFIGSEDTTYNFLQRDHITINNSTITLNDIIDESANKYIKKGHLELMCSYTYESVTKNVRERSSSTTITFPIDKINEHDNSVDFSAVYSPTIYCIENGVETTTKYINGSRTIYSKKGTMSQKLTVSACADIYNFETVIKDDEDNGLVNTDSMNITERLGNVSLKQAASMLLNNTDNAKNKVYIGDYFELGGYTWQNASGTTFTAGTAKYTLVERTSDGHLIFMSSERHKLTSETFNALTWTKLITENKLETLLLPQLESILGITPVSYTRKSDIAHLRAKKVFLPTEYEIFGKYTYQNENERYSGERQWEAFNFNKEADRKYFRRDVFTGDIKNFAPSNNSNGWGYWLANNSSRSGDASIVYYPDYSNFGSAYRSNAASGDYGVRPCFML